MAFFPPGLVWLASYPKSGNTWMRVLLRNLMKAGDQPADINRLASAETLISRWRFDDDLLVDSDMLTWRELERLRPLQYDFAAAGLAEPFFCKTHDSFRGRSGEPALGIGARAAIYLVRDPRDIAVSLCHHAGLSLAAAIENMTDATFWSGGGMQVPYLQGDWAGHVLGWTAQRQLDIKIVRYEDLRQDTAAKMRETVTFLGARATAAEIDRAVGHSSLEELRRQEEAKGFRESRPGQHRFFRSGRSGEWRDVMSASQVRSIEERCGPVMTDLGYRLEG